MLRVQSQYLRPKKEVANDKKEKTQGKTVQEIDRRKIRRKIF